MYPSTRLLQRACRITFFTRANCSLCTNAKQILSSVWDIRPFEYKEIDVMKESDEAKGWRDLYEFDTPVVCGYIYIYIGGDLLMRMQIHISSSKTGAESSEMAAKAKKLMHRFTAEEVKAQMDIVEGESV